MSSPQSFEFLAVQNRLPGLRRPAFLGFLDLNAPGRFTQLVGYGIAQRFKFVGQCETAIRQGITQLIRYLALAINVTCRYQVSPQFLRLFHAQMPGLTASIIDRD